MNQDLRWPVVLVLLACLGSCAGRASSRFETEPPPDRTLSPYFQVTGNTADGVDVLPLKDTDVEVTIAGVIAEVAVTQTYANEGAVPLEAVYVFPGSTRAAVHGLTMTVGDRVVRAQIQERAKARRTYEAAKASGRTASLLEQQRPNVFQMSLANILPGDVVRVELRYTELIESEDGEYEFVFPTVVGPRYSERPESGAAGSSPDDEWVGMPIVPTAEDTQATFGFDLHLAAGVPVSELQCPTHPVRITTPTPGDAYLTLAPEADPAAHANRDLIVRYRLRGDAMQTGLLLSRVPGTDEGYFLALIQPPARPEPSMIPPRDYVFVVDVSGSMEGFPLDTTRHLLADLGGSLRESDTFNLVLFAGSAGVLSSQPVPATDENLAAAIILLERQQAGGGTRLLPALETAFRLPTNESAARTVVVVTDGYVDIEAEAFTLVRRHLDDASLFAFGIGKSVNRHLIEGLARAGQGAPFVVTSADEADIAAARFRTYIESPVLTHVRASFEGFGAMAMVPAAIPDVFADRPVTLFGKWRGNASGTIVLEGTSGEGAFSTRISIPGAIDLGSNRAIELLWARARIAALEDEQLGQITPERVHAITQLGLTHGLLTRHTSFVAVDERVRNTDGASLPVRQPVALPEGVSPAAIPTTTVPTTPEPGVTGLMIITIAALAWAQRRRMLAERRRE